MSSLKPIDVLAKILISAARAEHPYSNQKFDILTKVLVNFRNFVVQDIHIDERPQGSVNIRLGQKEFWIESKSEVNQLNDADFQKYVVDALSQLYFD